MGQIAKELVAQLRDIARRFGSPGIAGLHVPATKLRPGAPARDAEFCAIELDDGSFGLSYVLLGDTLDQLTGRLRAGETLAGTKALDMVAKFTAGSPVERALALACINALTDSVWRRIGYAPQPAGNSLGELQLMGQDHLGMIGFFPPLVRKVQACGAQLTVVELNEATAQRQRERFPEVRVTLDRTALASCNRVVGTSTMLLNDTLDEMLAAAPHADSFAVIGPSAGLWPDALFARGVTLMGGTRVIDGGSFRQAMASGESWSGAAQKFSLARAGWPGWKVLLA